MITKILLIFVGTAFLVSCNPKSATETSDQSIKKDSLEQISETNIDEQTQGGKYAGIALERLNIKSEDCCSEFITEKILPYDTTKSVVVIPKISHRESDDFFLMDAYIVIVDHGTHEILHKFYESEAWTSDAMRFLGIEIDTAPYRLNSSTRAFGVRVTYSGSSRVCPYSETLISLFIPKGKELVRVLEDFPISIYRGEFGMGCQGDESSKETVLVVAGNQTEGYNDIIAQSTISTTKYKNSDKEDTNDCEEESSTENDTQTIRFQGGKYTFEKKEF